jgi:hypothetical protein
VSAVRVRMAELVAPMASRTHARAIVLGQAPTAKHVSFDV